MAEVLRQAAELTKALVGSALPPSVFQLTSTQPGAGAPREAWPGLRAQCMLLSARTAPSATTDEGMAVSGSSDVLHVHIAHHLQQQRVVAPRDLF